MILKILRIINNYSQQKVADILEITKATYNKKENGKVAFSISEAKQLADLFKVPLKVIINSEDENGIYISAILDSLSKF
ncbi:hypothetical protein JCM1393_21240 [Clostridium carnis]